MEDLGKAGLAKEASFGAGSFKLSGGGQLAGTADSGCYVWQMISGDGSITARVTSPLDSNNLSRTGVMIRDSLAANSKQIFTGINGGGGMCMTWRASTGGITKTDTRGKGIPPNVWLHIVRKGKVIYVFQSSNGSKWYRAGYTSVPFATHCYIGLFAGSGGPAANNATFDNVKVVP